MEEKDFQELIGKVNDSVKDVVKTEIENATSGLATSEQVAEKFEALGIEEKTIEEIKTSLETQGEEMRKYFESLKPNHGKELGEIIREKAEEIKAIAKGESNVGVKLAATKTQITRAGLASGTLGERVPGIGQLPYLGAVMEGLFRPASVGPNNAGTIRYIDQANITRNAGTVAEGAVKPESAIDWIERSLPIEKIADSIPVTKEAFADIEFIESEIDRLLNVNLALKKDEQLWDGDGVSPNLSGVYTTAPAFNAVAHTSPTAAVATLYDLLAILRVEIVNGKQSKYMPNGVVMNPADILKYKLAKATDGHYVLPPFISENGAEIDGMRVIESSQVDANTMCLGDWRYGTLYSAEDVNIEVGFVNDQFIRNAKTILAEERCALLIRNVDADAFLKVTDIDAAITAVTT